MGGYKNINIDLRWHIISWVNLGFEMILRRNYVSAIVNKKLDR